MSMKQTSKRALYWTPRAVSIALILFLSMFALDVFDGRHGFLETMQALAIHLIPSLVLTAALILAWRWEWIGSALFAGAGLFYISVVLHASWPMAMKTTCILAISGPALLVATLFLVNWFNRGALHAGRNAR